MTDEHTTESLGRRILECAYYDDKDSVWDIANDALTLLRAKDERLRELELAESDYRHCYERDGGDAMTTGRAWDHMRKTGDRARAALSNNSEGG